MTNSGDVVTIQSLSEHVGASVTLTGWVMRVRSSGKVSFIVLRDGTGLCQAVMEKHDDNAELFATIGHLGQESAIRVTGTVRADERAPGGYEMAVSDASIIHETNDFPITPKPHGTEFLFKHRHLWLRSQRQATILRIRDTLIFAIRDYFHRNNFVLVDTPIFAPSAGEGAQTLFRVDYFDQEVFLAQTGQLYLESAAMALRKVYCFGPTFRAEKSKTRRHLTEFWMVEPEICFVDLPQLMDIAEDFVCFVVQRVLENHRKDLESLGRDIAPLEKIQKPFFRLTYDEAMGLLKGPQAEALISRQITELNAKIDATQNEIADLEKQQAATNKSWQQEKIGSQLIDLREQLSEYTEQVKNLPSHLELAKSFEWGQDLGGSDETIISQLHDRPVFVTHYPRNAKAFYMRQDRSRSQVVENFDLLASEGYGEVIGGSVREEELDRLTARMDEEHLGHEPYEWYLDLRRYGSVPHGGFGLGIERTIAWLCGMKHIREAIAYPRMMGRVYP